ncbi:uncharacterized protein FOMMEDRAFT_20543 [Fomitiporia mediterranea MF3/22]|uniref:uncharacterized protein n=1 Tax=Fomitiporia mediterranea (strain MF3/22) TaxID=694068 RepID=UPI0004408671|nr:uncharacterized protein FOMMEDRAFT_20543 [Fomitiporia mediterranea MF3/22]EJD03472.1 hypothetical protein FOMMEDRAFT_20543 [Fomitiporia mediterranea MF3/22]
MAQPLETMPRSGDGDDVFTSQDGLEPSVVPDGDLDDVLSASNTNASDLRATLQSLLDSKERQLQQAGTLGQRVLAQQMELEERVRQFQDMDANRGDRDEPSAEMRLQYRDLANTIQSWNEENAKLSSAFSGRRRENGALPSQDLSLPDDVPQEPPTAHHPSAPSASQSRRAKNAAHRANDVEFAFEIGSSLLTEVRRLQSLLGERDKAIQDMKEEKDDLEKAVEALKKALREQEQNADKFKEENWNLEVSLQELRTQLADVQSTAQRSESETKRLTKALATAREQNDSSKNEVDRLQRTIEDAKNKHETDVALHRKQTAALARDKSDLQQAVDTYKAELARASRRLPRYGSPLTPDGRSDAQTPRTTDDEEDLFGPGTTGMGMSTNRRRMDTSGLFPPDAFGPDYVDASPEPSPSKPFLSPNHPSNEIEALQQKLAHAQRQISTLKGTLAREKELRIEYRRKMIEAGLQGQRLDDEEDDEEEVDSEGRQPRSNVHATTIRGRGRGRGTVRTGARGGGRTLAQKLIAAKNRGDEESDEEYLDEESEAYPSTALPDTTGDERAADTSMTSIALSSPTAPTFAASPSPEPLSNRDSVTSVEGMDPEFANILRRVPSASSSASRRGSPFTNGTVRGRVIGARRRGGTAFQGPRPSSLVGAPEALASELGLANTSAAMESVREDGEFEKVLVEVACQTDFEEVAPTSAPVIPAVSKPEMADVSVQAEPVPEVAPLITKPETAEMAIQAEPEPKPEVTTDEAAIQPVIAAPVVVRSESSVQTVEPARLHISIGTEPEKRPALVDSGTSTEPPTPVSTSSVVTQTDPIPEPEPIVREVQVMQPTPQRSDAETQTSPRSELFLSNVPNLPSSPLAQRRLRYLSTASTATAVPNRPLQVVQDESEEEDSHTELAYASAGEPETETDADDFRDAMSQVPTATVSESLNDDDFHSMSTMTDNDFSDEEDEEDTESIKASVLGLTGPSGESGSVRRSEQDITEPARTYECAAVSTDPPKEDPKRELSEMSIQTDEWQPPPAVSPIASTPQGFGLYRVGPNSQQFQFVPPASSLPASAVSTPISPITSTPPVQALRDATNTVGARPMRFSSPSLPVEGNKSAVTDGTPDIAQRQHTQSFSSGSPTIDKSRPPTMMLPPPPKMPPPPNSMPPPSFIPEKRRPNSALSSHRDMPPPRPSSPPPPELIQRATTPLGSLTVPSRGASGSRQHGSSLPPMSVLRQPTSINSFRSAANASALAQLSSGSSQVPFIDRQLHSAASLLSDQEDMMSRRSSISSDFHHNRALSDEHAGTTVLNTPGTQSRTANMPSSSTDPAIIHAITQTMIGEWLYKYTRRTIGKGHGERRHKRFFWVHPYTKTLYWSSGDPGSTTVTEQSAKSAYIDSVRSVLDPNPMPPGLYQYSIVISTPQREMKFTAPTKERHEIWLNALNFLLARPTPTAQSPTATQVHGPPVTPVRNAGAVSPMSRRTGRTEASGMSNESPWSVTNVTPRGTRRSRSRVSMAGSVGKRSNTPAAEYLRWIDGPGSPGANSVRGFEFGSQSADAADDEELDFEIHDSITSEREGFEGLENVRACCDGRHTVGRDSGMYEHHHHHNHDHVPGHVPKPAHVHRPIPQFARPEPPPERTQSSRPSSPAFSFRSRTSSRKSGEGVGNLFSRFGTRRSKTPAVSQDG